MHACAQTRRGRAGAGERPFTTAGEAAPPPLPSLRSPAAPAAQVTAEDLLQRACGPAGRGSPSVQGLSAWLLERHSQCALATGTPVKGWVLQMPYHVDVAAGTRLGVRLPSRGEPCRVSQSIFEAASSLEATFLLAGISPQPTVSGTPLRNARQGVPVSQTCAFPHGTAPR